MSKKTDLFTQEEIRTIEKMEMLREVENRKEADRRARIRKDNLAARRKEADRRARIQKNDRAADRKGEQAARDKAEQQRIYQQALAKAIEKGTLL